MKFYLGTHNPSWLWKTTNVPLFVSRRRLDDVGNLQEATCEWALDSGGFSELQMFGCWLTSEKGYANRVRRYSEIGMMRFAAPQDWMCEPPMLRKTGFSVEKHQQLTLDNFLALRDMAPEIPWIPVLQGWEEDDHIRHAGMYLSEGVDLLSTTVGVGSVCRRQGTDEIHDIFARIAEQVPGIKMHGFGVKTLGLRKFGQLLDSADSMAWSFQARYSRILLPECEGTHINCANCKRFALKWYAQLLEGLCTT